MDLNDYTTKNYNSYMGMIVFQVHHFHTKMEIFGQVVIEIHTKKFSGRRSRIAFSGPELPRLLLICKRRQIQRLLNDFQINVLPTCR
jgi:hypothetical protein